MWCRSTRDVRAAAASAQRQHHVFDGVQGSAVDRHERRLRPDAATAATGGRAADQRLGPPQISSWCAWNSSCLYTVLRAQTNVHQTVLSLLCVCVWSEHIKLSMRMSLSVSIIRDVLSRFQLLRMCVCPAVRPTISYHSHTGAVKFLLPIHCGHCPLYQAPPEPRYSYSDETADDDDVTAGQQT